MTPGELARSIGEVQLDFHLRYRGALPTCSRTETRSREKQFIRAYISSQLEELWKVQPQLASIQLDKLQLGTLSGRTVEVRRPIRDEQHLFYYVPIKGCRFIPLITRAHELFCELDIRFLRRENPGDIIQGGDLDNRLKTLFDGLRMPLSEDEVPQDMPDQRQFCLLEDDSLIKKVTIDTGRLLGPIQDQEKETDVDLAIHVTIKVATPMWDNLSWL